LLSGKRAQSSSDKNGQLQKSVWSTEEMPSEKVGLFARVVCSIVPCQSSLALPPHLRHLLPIFNLRVLIFISQPCVSLALVLDNPQHISSESDDDVPTMCSRASTSRQVFPTSPKDSEFVENTITHLTNSTHKPFAFPGALLLHNNFF
jgi:hypothetical protein